MTLVGFRTSLLATVVLLSACGGSSEPNSTNAPAQLIALGDGQTGVVGQALAQQVGVRVVDAAGRTVRGANVSFEVLGGGSVASASGVSNDSGLVRTTWTLGTKVVEQRLVVRAADVSQVNTTIGATARADVAASLRVVSAPSTVRNGVAIAQPVLVAVADRYGNDVVSSGVQITASVPQHTVRGAVTATTDAGGQAAFVGLTVTGKSGAAALTFTANQFTGSAPVTITPGPARSLEPVGDSVFTAEPQAPGPAMRVRVLDESANPIPGANVLFNFVAMTTTSNAVADGNGIASYADWRFPPKVGTYGVIVTSDSAKVFTFTVNARVGLPASVERINVPQTLEVGTSRDIVVRILDPYGNPVPFTRVTWGAPIGGRVSPTSGTTDEEGFVLTNVTMPRTSGSTRTRVTMSTGVAQDVIIAATAGMATRIVVGAPVIRTVAVGSTFDVRVSAYDKYDNLVPRTAIQTSTVTGAAKGTISPLVGTTDSTGVATFTVLAAAVASAQTFTLSASSNVIDYLFVQTSGASLPGIYASTQELTTGARHIFRCTVFVFKADGIGQQGVPIAVTLGPGQGRILDGGTTYSGFTDPNGELSLNWELPSPGTFLMGISAGVSNLYGNPTVCRATAY